MMKKLRLKIRFFEGEEGGLKTEFRGSPLKTVAELEEENFSICILNNKVPIYPGQTYEFEAYVLFQEFHAKFKVHDRFWIWQGRRIAEALVVFAEN